MRATMLLLLLCGVSPAATATEIRLWPNGAPGSAGKTAAEVVEPPNQDHGYLKVTGVHQPSLTVYLPPAGKASGAAMIIAPGGGHAFLNFDQEGTYVAAYLNSIRVAGFVLKYRLARGPASPRSTPDNPEAADPADPQRPRPDFDALIYPGIRANAYTIPKDMPVTFLLCADNDRGPSTALSALYPMLKAAGIQTEVHVYATGGHGFGINPNTRNPSPAATSWQLRLGDWLKQIGMLP